MPARVALRAYPALCATWHEPPAERSRACGGSLARTAARGLPGVAGQGDRHRVLERVRGVFGAPIDEEAEREQVPAERLAPAGEVGDAVERAGLGLAAAFGGAAAHAADERAAAPGDREVG